MTIDNVIGPSESKPIQSTDDGLYTRMKDYATKAVYSGLITLTLFTSGCGSPPPMKDVKGEVRVVKHNMPNFLAYWNDELIITTTDGKSYTLTGRPDETYQFEKKYEIKPGCKIEAKGPFQKRGSNMNECSLESFELDSVIPAEEPKTI